MHEQVQQDMWSALLPFIEVLRSEPADEDGWTKNYGSFQKLSERTEKKRRSRLNDILGCGEHFRR